MDVDKLKAGRALDRLIAEKVMGCHVTKRPKGTFDLIVPGGVNSVDWVEEEGAWSGMPSYSTDISSAWEVVERILAIEKKKKTYLPVFLVEAAPDGCSAVLQVEMGCQIVIENASTAPLAICRAALKAAARA